MRRPTASPLRSVGPGWGWWTALLVYSIPDEAPLGPAARSLVAGRGISRPARRRGMSLGSHTDVLRTDRPRPSTRARAAGARSRRRRHLRLRAAERRGHALLAVGGER